MSKGMLGMLPLSAVRGPKDALDNLLASNDGERVLTELKKFVRREPCWSQKLFSVPFYYGACHILGDDFISPAEITKARGVTYTVEQLARFGEMLPDEETLKWCRDQGLMLVAGPPSRMSLLDVRSIKADYFYSKEGDWYADKTQKFAKNDKAEPVWIALRKDVVADSRNKTWPDQQSLICAPMAVPNVAEAVWGITTYKAVRGVYLLPDCYVRTSSVDSDGFRVDVGIFDADGLLVNSCWDGNRFSFLGVSASRKFPAV